MAWERQSLFSQQTFRWVLSILEALIECLGVNVAWFSSSLDIIQHLALLAFMLSLRRRIQLHRFAKLLDTGDKLLRIRPICFSDVG